ncbi:MAG: tetratricopeptide repeat protein [Pseudomonadota bacterium]|nr:tetratricopeptide repeat protein [Pseudomonadota bacterium]
MTDNIASFESDMKQGTALLNKHFKADALVFFKRALNAVPNSVSALYNIAKIQQELGNYEEALNTLIQLFQIQGNDASMETHAMTLEISKRIARWDIHNKEREWVKDLLKQGQSMSPFPLLSEPFSNQELYSDTLLFTRDNPSFAPKPTYYSFDDRTYADRRIKIAFISADFNFHPVSYVISNLFESIDSKKFQVYLYDIDQKNSEDHERKKRIQTKNVFYRKVSQLSDKQIADQIFSDEIDILIDLNGFTSFNKLSTLTYRPAPIQATFLGYSGTLGKIPGVDYILCDQYVLPPSEQKYYGEKFVYLPCYFTYDVKNSINPALYKRKSLGLPEDKFVLACFCNDYKYTTEYIDIWLRILQKVPETVLWLFAKSPLFEKNMLDYAQKFKIDGNRIIFARFLPSHADHLARYRCADLFLDTQYYNAHTTAAEALFAGCPLITCPGQTFASRVCGSILNTLDMPELIAKDVQEYEEKILFYASHPNEWAKIKEKLADKKKTSPFFDSDLYARHFEKVCMDMIDTYKKENKGAL